LLMTKRKESSMLEGRVQIRTDESIKLIRGQRGNYGWEIKVTNPYIEGETVARLKRIDKMLQEAFAVDEDKGGEKCV